ncbi:FkbM family methyltransferase [Synechocystis sp. PCC 7338]|uniref:FkbM family methyltransferase n=1 Tax=Synechocystis sp. PCC 7338 TaxID=2732530 RepID=UPI001BB07D92|nr:FkbM family methyltransferase [Synechocystis sp. PCC 7338]QUS59321.1 FkbM family methyltransferase [Synechocystis sp. PCC 7338]
MSNTKFALIKKAINQLYGILLKTNKNALIYSKEKYNFHNLSFSQEGEDLVLNRLFEQQSKGFYVDVGAHHPQRFSNTYLFYLKGWRGINIDAMPGSMEIFKQLRPEDINLEIAISDNIQELTYYQFNESALNGFSEELSRQRDGIRREYFILNSQKIKTQRLSEILDYYLPQDQVIDFLTIDVEGLDYQVLKSNNWKKYRPSVVLIEMLGYGRLEDLHVTEIGRLMEKEGYKLFARTINTSFYQAYEFKT